MNKEKMVPLDVFSHFWQYFHHERENRHYIQYLSVPGIGPESGLAISLPLRAGQSL
jgi:hypothetical protein